MTCDDGCRHETPTTPLPVANRPGLPSLATRIGTFSSFRQTMLERIVDHPQLASLTTRDSDDHSVAILEQWAAVADVLTFYSERYANEAYLRTAVLPETLRRLAGLIGYRARPGLSATTTLALWLSEDTSLRVPAGFPVQSVPGPEERPQIFETLEDCAAASRLNELPARPAPTAVADPLRAPRGARVEVASAAAVAADMRPGDVVLLVKTGAPGSVTPATVSELVVEREHVRLRLSAAPPSGVTGAKAFVPRRVLRVFGHDMSSTAVPKAQPNSSVPGGVQWIWEAPSLSLSGTKLHLDRAHDDVAVGTSLLLSVAGGDTRVVQVTAVEIETATLGERSAAVTAVTISSALPEMSDRRKLQIVELDGAALPLATSDYSDAFGNEVWIPGVAVIDDDGRASVRVAAPVGATVEGPVIAMADFAPGRRVILTDARGSAVATVVHGTVRREPATATAGASCHLVVPVQAAAAELASLDPVTTRLLGNAAAASHGQTVAGEVLGSGDATVAFQRFALAKGPLTRVPAPTPEGSIAAFSLTVDGVLWPEVPHLLAAGPADEVVALRMGADGTTVVQSGDGTTGVRVPTGAGNVRATYRHGAGLAGRVGADSLTQPLSRIPGVETVTNPVAAQGGADEEGPTELRTRAPGSVRVLGRAVSAADTADLLLSTGLVAKASAATVSDGRGPVVGVTVAGADGGQFDLTARRMLADVVRASSPPYRRVVVVGHVSVPLTVSATLFVEPRHDPEAVRAAVAQAILDRVSFEQVGLGEPFHLSDLYAAAYTTPGVANLNVTQLAFVRPAGTSDAAWEAFRDAHGAPAGDPLPERIRLLRTRASDSGDVLPAEVPTLAAPALTVTLGAAPPRPTAGGLV